MKWSAVRRKLARVDRAIDKAIEAAEIPGAVVLADGFSCRYQLDDLADVRAVTLAELLAPSG